MDGATELVQEFMVEFEKRQVKKKKPSPKNVKNKPKGADSDDDDEVDEQGNSKKYDFLEKALHGRVKFFIIIINE